MTKQEFIEKYKVNSIKAGIDDIKHYDTIVYAFDNEDYYALNKLIDCFYCPMLANQCTNGRCEDYLKRIR